VGIDGARRRTAAGVLALAAIACSQESGPQDAVARGRQVYSNVCATCHGPDPNRDGTVGPAVAGASRELLEAKLLHGSYPKGYEPKRGSRLMPKLGYLGDAIPDLAAYLAAVKS
jgi:mono/diheme cytochrome c family protein